MCQVSHATDGFVCLTRMSGSGGGSNWYSQGGAKHFMVSMGSNQGRKMVLEVPLSLE